MKQSTKDNVAAIKATIAAMSVGETFTIAELSSKIGLTVDNRWVGRVVRDPESIGRTCQWIGEDEAGHRVFRVKD